MIPHSSTCLIIPWIAPWKRRNNPDHDNLEDPENLLDFLRKLKTYHSQKGLKKKKKRKRNEEESVPGRMSTSYFMGETNCFLFSNTTQELLFSEAYDEIVRGYELFFMF